MVKSFITQNPGLQKCFTKILSFIDIPLVQTYDLLRQIGVEPVDSNYGIAFYKQNVENNPDFRYWRLKESRQVIFDHKECMTLCFSCYHHKWIPSQTQLEQMSFEKLQRHRLEKIKFRHTIQQQLTGISFVFSDNIQSPVAQEYNKIYQFPFPDRVVLIPNKVISQINISSSTKQKSLTSYITEYSPFKQSYISTIKQQITYLKKLQFIGENKTDLVTVQDNIESGICNYLQPNEDFITKIKFLPGEKIVGAAVEVNFEDEVKIKSLQFLLAKIN